MDKSDDIFADLLSGLQPEGNVDTKREDPPVPSMEATRRKLPSDSEIEVPVERSDTPVGENLSPPPPPMTKEETQRLVRDTVRELLLQSFGGLTSSLRDVLSKNHEKLIQIENAQQAFTRTFEELKTSQNEQSLETKDKLNRMEGTLKEISVATQRMIEKQDLMDAHILLNRHIREEKDEEDKTKSDQRLVQYKKHDPVVEEPESEEDEGEMMSPVKVPKKPNPAKQRKQYYEEDDEEEMMSPVKIPKKPNPAKQRKQYYEDKEESRSWKSGGYEAEKMEPNPPSRYMPENMIQRQPTQETLPSYVPPPPQPLYHPQRPGDPNFQLPLPSPPQHPGDPNFQLPLPSPPQHPGDPNFRPPMPSPPQQPPFLRPEGHPPAQYGYKPPPTYGYHPPPSDDGFSSRSPNEKPSSFSPPTSQFPPTAHGYGVPHPPPSGRGGNYPAVSLPMSYQQMHPTPTQHHPKPIYGSPPNLQSTTSSTEPARTTQSVPLDQVINDVANMGFDRTKVRSIVTQLLDRGESVDLNVVIDRLTRI